MTLISMAYQLQSKPMKQVKENKLILFNEAVTLGISYLFMVINGICYSEE